MRIYNTMSGNVEELKTVDPDKVKIYSCGLTTYDEIHLGHARQAIVFDILRNYLEYRGYSVDYVRNFTDIDDKIINRANLQGKTAHEVSEYYIKENSSDLAKLKVKSATYEPKVTEHIPEIIEFIDGLIKKGFAYVSNGEVLFDVDKFKEYGKLSGRKTEDMISQEESTNKNKFYDFTLWKPCKEGEPYWDSPWGKGRPGWHIECSALSKTYLGKTIDIHGGGIDLLFPHHENEITQSEALNDAPLANIWMHNGLVMVNSQKMSKSLGNFHTIKDLLKKYTADEIRFTVLIHNYSTPIDLTDELFSTVKKRVFYFYNVLARVENALDGKTVDTANVEVPQWLAEMEETFKTEMDNNLNTAHFIAHLSGIFNRINEILDNLKENDLPILALFREKFRVVSGVLKIFDENPLEYILGVKKLFLEEKQMSNDELQKLLEERSQAKQQKNYDRADAIRKELELKGISLRDSSNNQTEWDIII